MFIQTLARILAAKFNLVVEFSHSVKTFSIGRRHDGTLVITMASDILEANAEHEAAIGVLFRGALAHEALGHGYHTDFDVESMAKEGPFARSLANAFEDVRVEALAPLRFMGARRLLSEMSQVLDRDLAFWSPNENDWQECLLIGLLRKYRTQILHQPIDQEATSRALASAEAVMGADLLTQVDALAEAACRSSSTAEVSSKADDIVRLLRAAQPQPQAPEPPSTIAEDGDQGEKGDGGDQGGDRAGDKGSEASQGAGGESDRESDEAGAANAGDEGRPGDTHCEEGDGERVGGSGSAGNEGESAEGDPRHENGVAGRDDASSEGQCDSGRGRGEASRSARSFDENKACNVDVEAAIQTISEPDGGYLESTALKANAGRDDSESMLEIAKGVRQERPDKLVQRIASRLAEVVRSITEDEDDDETDLGRLDISRLPAIAAGLVSDPFLVEGNPGRGIDTEIMLVMDASGSMRRLGHEFLRTLLQSSVLAMARFSPDLGISVATFGTESRLLVKPGQHIAPRLAAAMAHAYCPSGGTEWSKSVVPLVPLLAQSRRRRKILLTITDGCIDATPDSGLMRDMASHGIECRFVSINNPLPRGFEGVQCAIDAGSFAKAFCDTILASLPPAYA